MFSETLMELTRRAERDLAPMFAQLEQISLHNTKKVMDAFREYRVSEAMFAPSTGYGYDDRGRDTLDRIYACVMGTEAALVRHQIFNGTHALTVGLYGLLRPGDTLLAVTGKPYDTLDEVIGLSGTPGNGSLRDFGIQYRQCELGEDFLPMLDEKVKVVFIQRSKGYMNRRTLSVDEINAIIDRVRAHSKAYVVVDNCYGEFTEETEPRADLLIGSLIKNPGGGIAEAGGYLAGSARAVELASYRLTSVGTGGEVGATLGNTRNMYKGLFFAPHITIQAVKTALLASYIFEDIGYSVEPTWRDARHDIIQVVRLGSPEALCAFCRGIQKGSPVDAFVTPEPYDMPGYSDQVIMAAGAFTQGSSIELSADGPMREPYNVYFQGGLTYESGKIGILTAAQEILDAK